jgi:hypothetical protein
LLASVIFGYNKFDRLDEKYGKVYSPKKYEKMMKNEQQRNAVRKNRIRSDQ